MLRSSLLAAVLAFSTLPAFAQTPDPDAALGVLFHDVWEDRLTRSPVFASSLGDLRYNDQLPDLSPRAFNDRIAAEHGFLIRVLSIDPTSLSEQQRRSVDFLQREFVKDMEAAPAKEWELPVGELHGIQTDLPDMADNLPFATVKDYDDYIARLHLIPRQLRQASENLLAGIDAHRVQPASILQNALRQTEELANQAPAASPFARPLKKFHATIDAAQQRRISADLLDAIQTDVMPAYVRFAKFLRVTEIPGAAQASPDLPSRPLSYAQDEAIILGLRAKAMSTLGSRFDLKTFHDIVVNHGFLPMDVLNQQVSAWIATSR